MDSSKELNTWSTKPVFSKINQLENFIGRETPLTKVAWKYLGEKVIDNTQNKYGESFEKQYIEGCFLRDQTKQLSMFLNWNVYY